MDLPETSKSEAGKGWYHLNLEFPKSGMQVAYMEFIMEKKEEAYD